MVSRRIVVGLLAGALTLSLTAGPAVGAPRLTRSDATNRPVQGDRSSAIAAAVRDSSDRLPTGPGTFSATPGQPGRHTSVTEILTGARNRRDLRNWLGAIAAAIKATSGADVAIAAPQVARGDSDSPAADPGEAENDDEPVPYTGSWAETYPAGDLDGDGHGDVVTYHIDLETWAITLEAARGDTGTVLWERADDAEGGLAWPLQQDLSGDGSADLLVYSLDILSDSMEDCWNSDDEGCWDDPWEATFRWTVGLVSGADGATVWTRDLDGWVHESFSEQAGSSGPVAVHTDEEVTYELAGENLDVLPFIADLDGNGRPEVILNALDLADRFTASDSYVRSPAGSAGRWEGGWSLVSTTRVSVIDGSGSDVRQLEDGGAGRISLLWPLDQPDGSADAVWERSLYPDTNHECLYASIVLAFEHCPVDEYGDDAFELAVLDGHTFEQQWTTVVEGYGGAWPVGGDLDADSRNDIATWTIDWDTAEDRARLLSGATGAALWGDDVVIRDVMVTGALDDAAGDDVIAIDYDETYDEASDTSTLTVHFQRRHGATGALLGQTTHTAQDGPAEGGWDIELLYATAGPDGSGDGAPDLTVGKIVLEVRGGEDEDEPWFSVEPAHSSAVAESGATGEPLYTFAGMGYGVARMASDFDGDGLTEAAQLASSYGREDMAASFTPVRLTDGAPLWTDEATGAFVFYTWGGEAGDASVYRHVDTLDEPRHFSTLVTALDGGTGVARWSLTSRP